MTKCEKISPKEFLQTVINPTLYAFPAKFNSKAVRFLLLGTALKESHLKHRRQFNDGPARGLFQMEPDTAFDIYHNYLAHRPQYMEIIENLRGHDDVEEALENNDKYACAMARIHYWRVSEKLPGHEDIEGLGRYWKTYYNTYQGAGTAEQFIKTWQENCEGIE